MYGYKCLYCGAYLDPGEKCDCIIEREKAAELKKEPTAKKKRTSRKKKIICGA